MEDTAVKSRLAVIVQSSKESTQDFSKLDDEVDSSARLRRFDLTYSHIFRFRSLRSHCITRTRSVYSCKVSRTTQQNSSRYGWNHSREIWRVSLGVGRAKAPPFVQRSFGGVISSGFPGSKKLSRYKKGSVWLPSHELVHCLFSCRGSIYDCVLSPVLSLNIPVLAKEDKTIMKSLGDPPIGDNHPDKADANQATS